MKAKELNHHKKRKRKEDGTISEPEKKKRVAIVGVENYASPLMQGVQLYRNAKDDERIPGPMHANLGGYRIGGTEFSAAFDVMEVKVGKDLSEAVFASPNNTIKFNDVPHIGEFIAG